MSDRRIFRTLRTFGTIFLVNVVILAFLVLGFGREYLRNRAIEQSIADLAAENDALEGKKLESLSVISALSSEYYLEGEARRKHGLAKPGESVTIVGDGTVTPTVPATDADAAQGASNARGWWEYFFDHEGFDRTRTL